MKLGAFSISLTVEDLAVSRRFYEDLGFGVVGGDAEQRWLILRNPDAVTIGLFQGMFDRNLMTFNPGWDREARELPEFMDVREIQERLDERGVTVTSRADPATTGPASLMLEDPDGNQILIDQHR